VGDENRAMAILVVDDEPHMRQTLDRALSAYGHRIDQAATYREAVAASTAIPYDLLLLDVNLPDGTGWDVLRVLRARGKETPTVIVSAVPPSAKRVQEFPTVGVLHKPFPMDALLRLVRAAASERERTRDLPPCAEERKGGLP
jgi:DNA-binding response OmpR family regulator